MCIRDRYVPDKSPPAGPVAPVDWLITSRSLKFISPLFDKPDLNIIFFTILSGNDTPYSSVAGSVFLALKLSKPILPTAVSPICAVNVVASTWYISLLPNIAPSLMM